MSSYLVVEMFQLMDDKKVWEFLGGGGGVGGIRWLPDILVIKMNSFCMVLIAGYS